MKFLGKKWMSFSQGRNGVLTEKFRRKKWMSSSQGRNGVLPEKISLEEMEFFQSRNEVPALPTLCISKLSSPYPNFPARNDRDIRSVTKLSTRNAETARKVRRMRGQFWNGTIRNIDFCGQGHPIIYSKILYSGRLPSWL